MKWITSASIPCREIEQTHKESHSTVSTNPVYRVTLEVDFDNVKAAIQALLGLPEEWPKDTMFEDVVAVSAEGQTNGGQYATDSDGEVLSYDKYLIDVTYIQRSGVYLEDSNGSDVYWNDEHSPRIESRPMNHTLLKWGTTTPSGSGSVPTESTPLDSTEAPSRYIGGETLEHTIEGWSIDYTDLDDLIGTVHDAAYTSPVSGVTYAADTLLLRSFTSVRGWSFISYRSLVPTTTLKLIYEFKDVGWNRFWRINLRTTPASEDYYYILANQQTFKRIDPFPSVSHLKYLS